VPGSTKGWRGSIQPQAEMSAIVWPAADDEAPAFKVCFCRARPVMPFRLAPIAVDGRRAASPGRRAGKCTALAGENGPSPRGDVEQP